MQNNSNSSQRKSPINYYLELSTFINQKVTSLWFLVLVMGLWEKLSISLIILNSLTRTSAIYGQVSALFDLGKYVHVI